jgi:cytochrome c
MRAVGDDRFGKLVTYGHVLMIDTATPDGPDGGADPAKRYAGNSLTSWTCRLKAGNGRHAVTADGCPNGAGMTGVLTAPLSCATTGLRGRDGPQNEFGEV